MFSTQILIEVEVKVLKSHFKDDTEARMVDIINMKVSLMEVNEKTLEEEEVMEVVLETIEVNNQIIATPLWGKCEDETRTPKSGNLESFGPPLPKLQSSITQAKTLCLELFFIPLERY